MVDQNLLEAGSPIYAHMNRAATLMNVSRNLVPGLYKADDYLEMRAMLFSNQSSEFYIPESLLARLSDEEFTALATLALAHQTIDYTPMERALGQKISNYYNIAQAAGVGTLPGALVGGNVGGAIGVYAQVQDGKAVAAARERGEQRDHRHINMPRRVFCGAGVGALAGAVIGGTGMDAVLPEPEEVSGGFDRQAELLRAHALALKGYPNLEAYKSLWATIGTWAGQEALDLRVQNALIGDSQYFQQALSNPGFELAAERMSSAQR